MNLQSEDVKNVIRALSRSENAMSLDEFVLATRILPESTHQILQFLKEIRVFQCDNSFDRSQIGRMVYSFAGNEQAQILAKAFEEERGV